MIWLYSHNNIGITWILIPFKTEWLTYDSLYPVSLYSTLDLAMDTYPQAVITVTVFLKDKCKSLAVQTFSLFINLFKFFILTQQAWLGKPVLFQVYQAESLLRPLARRALIIARPARVLMRALKPWARLRFKLLGWKVLLLICVYLCFNPLTQWIRSTHLDSCDILESFCLFTRYPQHLSIRHLSVQNNKLAILTIHDRQCQLFSHRVHDTLQLMHCCATY